MNLKDKVFFKLYAAEGDVSGESLAEELNVSRAAVWKAVKALREDGYTVSSGTNRGYKLCGGPADRLDALSLSAALGVKVIRLESVDSTNAYAQSLTECSPTLIIADRQTDGKARRGGNFSSPDGGLYMSYLFFPRLPLDQIPRLNERAADIAARVLGGERREQEIYLSNRKIAGVLTEANADMDGVNRVVIGIGVYAEGMKKSRRESVLEIVRELKEIEKTL